MFPFRSRPSHGSGLQFPHSLRELVDLTEDGIAVVIFDMPLHNI